MQPGQITPEQYREQLIQNAQLLVECWPLVLEAASGMVRQTETAGFSNRVAKAMVLSQLGIPVEPLSVDHL